MELKKELFSIDAPAAAERLCAFIRERQASLGRLGLLVPLSGGLDSSTVLLLCARAAGAENVTALLLPERQGNPAARTYARLIAGRFGIKTLTRNISPILAHLGAYRFILAWLPSRRLQGWFSRRYLERTLRKPFVHIVEGQSAGLMRRAAARYDSKQRVRAVVAYQVATERHLLLVGSAHKSEDMPGLFVKFGVDDIADLMPLKNLYRSQILQLAVYLGVPEEILQRTPSPDLVPGVEDKYMDMIGLPSETLDLLLYGLEHGMGDEEIASQLRLPLEQVGQIRSLVAMTEHMRNPSQTVTWE